MKREEYSKPEIRSEELEMGVYGDYPIPAVDPYFGLCPPCQ